MSSGLIPKYCSTCRTKLKWTEEFYSFDEDTGVRIYKYTLTCPKVNFFNNLFLFHFQPKYYRFGEYISYTKYLS